MTRALFLLVLLASCDNRHALQEPDPSLSRMLEQRRADPYAPSAVFADGKTMREPPRGTIAHDEEVTPSRPAITRALLVAGRERFEVVCATCHGITGNGVSVVATKMASRPPPTLHRPHTDEHIFTVVTQGYGLMPSYADQLSPHERWAVIGYLRALQLSQDAPLAALPASVRDELAREAP